MDRERAGRISAAVGTVVLVATVVVWYLVLGDVFTDYDPAYLRFAIIAIAGGAVVSAGLAVLVLLDSEPQTKARSRAKLALTFLTLAVLLALTSFAIDRG